MLQYVKFNENTVENARFETPRGSKGILSLSKKVLFLLFMMYATLFLAVATPFLPPNSPVIYIIGALISLGMLARLGMTFYRYFTLGKVSIVVHKK
ncbi:MAG TPA: hypothetical protein VF857_07055, partial [Spirochaetota bacterium]